MTTATMQVSQDNHVWQELCMSSEEVCITQVDSKESLVNGLENLLF